MPLEYFASKTFASKHFGAAFFNGGGSVLFAGVIGIGGESAIVAAAAGSVIVAAAIGSAVRPFASAFVAAPGWTSADTLAEVGT